MMLPAFSKTYAGVKALDFPGASPEPGRIYAILGANGSGKSTFAKIVAGVLPAASGIFRRSPMRSAEA